jgi:acyl-CoA thioester hydrolase
MTAGREEHRPHPADRTEFSRFVALTTRWLDNDVYGHLNNVVYYAFFDTAVNQILIQEKILDPLNSPIVGLVVDTRCSYFRPLKFPDAIEVGVRTLAIGTSSVRYAIGIFSGESPKAAAQGEFTHVYVDRTSQRPVPIPADVRTVIEALRKSLQICY